MGYGYRASDVSPQFYLTGPLTFESIASSSAVTISGSGDTNLSPFVLGEDTEASESATPSATPTETPVPTPEPTMAIATDSGLLASPSGETGEASSSAELKTSEEATSSARTIVFTESRQWQIAVDAATITQSHYRWRNDDGDSTDTGDGSDGALSLTASYNLNTTDSTADSDDNSTYADGIAFKVDPVTATTSGTMVKLYDTPTNPSIAAGDEVLLMNLQGASGDTADVGNYEFLTISSVNTTSKEVSFTSAITNSYDGSTPGNQKVVIQRIPQFTSVTLTSSGSITASPWNGLTPQSVTGITGYYTGIVAFRATGTVSLASGTSISVNALGYRGGADRSADGGLNGESYDGLPTDGGGAGCGTTDNCAAGVGVQGGGAGTDNNGASNTTATRGGGGGGGAENTSDATNGGGGGAGGGYGGGGGGGGGSADSSAGVSGTGGTAGASGGNSGVAAGGGGGAPTTTTTEADGGNGGAAGSAGSGGGGNAGNGGSAGSGTTTGEGGGANTTDEDSGGSGGGGGGMYGDTALSDIFLGSGGGAGGDSNEGGAGADGGNGGGIVFIGANTVTVTSTGSITSTGASGSAGGGATTPGGAGGAGSGGSVLIRAVNVTLGTNLVTAYGGTGGARGSSTEPAGAGGGDGGVGRIRVETGSVTSVTTSPSASLSSTTEGGATWAKAEDTTYTNIPTATTKRLRFEVSNEGDTSSGAVTYRLEVSDPDPSSCADASYTRVTSSSDWAVTASSYITDNDPTANITSSGTQALTDDNTTFISGKLEESTDELSSTITLGTTEFTEVEFSLQADAGATAGSIYCFRLTNGGSTTNFSYSQYALASIELVDNPDQIHYRWRNDDGNETAATWIVAEDTSTYLSRSTTKRLRISVDSAGTGSTGALTYRLEVSEANPTSCASGTYTRVDTDTAWDVAASGNIADGGATTNVTGGVSDPGTTFVAGLLEETSDTLNSSITLGDSVSFTEIEYAIQPTASALGQGHYCFRLTNSGSTTHFTYTKYVEAYVASPYHTQVHYRWRNDDGGETGAYIGDGADGVLTPSGTFNLNTSTSGARSYADGIAYKVAPQTATTSGTMVKLYDTPNGLAAGDDIMLINLQGASGDTADVGNYEIFTIDSVNATSHEITFTSAITKSYDGTTPGNQKVALQRVPNYSSVTLDSSDSITATAWDGLAPHISGAVAYYTGIVAFYATSTVTVGSGTSITVSGLGYRNGAGGAVGGASENGESYDGFVGSGGSGAAAGTSGGGNPGDVGTASPNNGAARSGGGGGGRSGSAASGNEGGGGGAGGGYGGGGGGGGGGGDTSNSGGNGGTGGDTSVNGGGGGGGGDQAAGGAGGPAGSAGSTAPGAGVGGQVGSGATSGSGGGGGGGTDEGGAGGGAGGYVGSTDLTTMFFGGGGGGGGASTGTGAAAGLDGGDGGGIIFVVAATMTITSTGTIGSDGTSGTNGTGRPGSGGAGSGGSVLIRTGSISVDASNLVTATGGTGGTRTSYGGGGGSGGVGRIRIETETGSITTNPTASTGTISMGTGATWATTQDTRLTDTVKDTIYRVRIEMSNEGQETASSTTYRLEVSGPNPTSCSTAGYTRVSSDTNWGMSDSSQFSDGTATTNVVPGITDENTTFAAGQIKDTGDQSSGLALTNSQFTEYEFAVSSSTFVNYGVYCFRLTNAGSTSDFSFSQYAEIYLGPQLVELMRHGNFFQTNVERYFSF